MKLDDILRLPNLKPYSNLEFNIIKQFLQNFAHMSYEYNSERLPAHDPKVLPFLQAGVLGMRDTGLEWGMPVNSSVGSTLVVKLSGGKGFLGGDRIRFHVFGAGTLYCASDDFSEIGSWKMLSQLLVRIAHSDHYPEYP